MGLKVIFLIGREQRKTGVLFGVGSGVEKRYPILLLNFINVSCYKLDGFIVII